MQIDNILEFDAVELVDRPWFPYLCTEVEHWQWHTEEESHYNLWVALGGNGYITCEGQTYHIQRGMFFVFPPKARISAANYSGERITRFSAHFFPLLDGQRLSSIELFPKMGEVHRSLSVLERRIDALMRIAARKGDESILAKMLYDLLRFCLDTTAPASLELQVNPIIGRAINLFREEPASVTSISELAKELGISRSHFDREFCHQVGIPPKQFLLNCKIILARRYLESTSMRIGEIGELLGYQDPYFFSRQFKQIVGMPPKEYRAALSSEFRV